MNGSVRTPTGTRFFSVLALAAVVVVGLTSCSSEHEPPDSLPQEYVDQIDSILANDETTDFARTILADYVVTDQELQEANDRYLGCVEEQGYEGYFAITGATYTARLSEESHLKLVREYQDDPDAGLEKELSIVNPCAMKTVMDVASIYARMHNNPKALDRVALLRDCLSQAGVADEAAAVSDEDLRAAITGKKFGEAAFKHCSTGSYVEEPGGYTSRLD